MLISTLCSKSGVHTEVAGELTAPSSQRQSLLLLFLHRLRFDRALCRISALPSFFLITGVLMALLLFSTAAAPVTYSRGGGDGAVSVAGQLPSSSFDAGLFLLIFLVTATELACSENHRTYLLRAHVNERDRVALVLINWRGTSEE
jgi:hypothetical protein